MTRVLRTTLLVVLLLFLPFLLEPFEGPKAAVVRIAGIGLLVAVVLRMRNPDRPRFWFGDLAIAAWLAVELAATLGARSPALALFGEWDQSEGLLTSLGLAGLWLAARHVVRDARSWERTLDVVFVGTALAGLVAVLQAVGLDPIPWVRVATLGGALRPFGTLGHPNLLGLVAAAAAAMATARALTARQGRGLYAAAALWLAIVVIVTLSRGAWLALGAGTMVAAIAAWSERAPLPDRRRGIPLVAGAALALVATFLLAGGWPRIAGRAAEIASAGSGSGRSRLEIWRAALGEWRDRPWLGQGPDNFSLRFPAFQTAEYWRTEWGGYAFHAHSVILNVLATRGILGLVATLAVVIAGALGVWRGWRAGGERRALAAAFGGGLVAIGVAGLFSTPGIAGSVLAALLLAGTGWLALSADAQPAPDAAPARSSRRTRVPTQAPRSMSAASVAGIVAALAVTVFSVRTLAASHDLWIARDSLDQLAGSPPALGAYASVAARLRSEMRSVPWDDLGPRLLAEALQVSGNGVPGGQPRLLEATAVSREAIQRQPLRSDAWRRLGDALASRASDGEQGLASSCDSAYARAAELAPMDCFMLVQWARARIATGRYREAREPAQRAVALYPDRGNPMVMVAISELAVGDSSAARRDLDRALGLEWYADGGAHDMAVQLRADLGAGRAATIPASASTPGR